jgi:hypothetical protein
MIINRTAYLVDTRHAPYGYGKRLEQALQVAAYDDGVSRQYCLHATDIMLHVSSRKA